ncbi:MAG: 23S rRNA (uracil(1939)-C(5))-methyltransferase RlmD [Candidatus Metalachnospira sp.]|nr:23S rRNA (uracil(1939)-C(5))-methyltransferase RlmD [Candidatus Metalachnospira sp.]
MKKNDFVELIINDIYFPNKGKGTIDDIPITVKNTIPGQKVLARITKKRNGVMEGELREIIERSPIETENGCSHCDVCGGCNYQRINYKEENKIKEKMVLQILNNAQIENYEFLGLVPAPEETGYRNKCEFSFGDSEKDGDLSLGMRKRGSFYEVVTLRDCNIIDNDFLKIIDTALKFFTENNIPFYHKKKHDGELRHLVVRKAAFTGEILINLITTSNYTFNPDEFAKTLLNTGYDGKIAGILHTLNDVISDVVQSDETRILYGNDYFYENLLGLKFKISAFSFFQTNSKGAEKLYSVVREFAGNTSGKTIFDLYCGTGTIGQIMSKGSKKVIGIEIVEEAVEAAKINSELNGITNCEFIAGDVLKKVDELEDKPDLIIVDPPRDGINPKAIMKIINFGAKEIIYVSCKPTSLARDLQIFEANGYKTKKVKCIDMFPRTVHTECVVKLEKS